MTKGWGKGNCFYEGVNGVTPVLADQGNHRFVCRNVGKLAKSAKLQLGF